VAANWDDLKVLLAVARVGSLTLAAEVLGIDQSTCGRRLSALEAGLGAILFLRSKSGLALTEAGETALARATEIELRMERLTESLANGPEGPEGIVRLVGNPWTLECLAGAAAARFLVDHPRIDLRLIPTHPRAAVRMEATLSLWFEQPPRESEFAIKLGEVPYAFYVRRGLDGASLPWVSFYDEDSPRLAHVKTLERVRRRDERLRLAAGDNRVLMAAIVAGIGKGLLPICLAAAHPDLERLNDGPADLVRVLNLHLHPDTVQTKRVQAVTRWLRENVGPVFGEPRAGK
jgi:DNA-binding transcriptional LysR family regulator